MLSSFINRAASTVLSITKKDIKAKLQVLESQLKLMEAHKDNPSVSRNYYTLLGKVEALKAIASDSRTELTYL